MGHVLVSTVRYCLCLTAGFLLPGRMHSFSKPVSVPDLVKVCKGRMRSAADPNVLG